MKKLYTALCAAILGAGMAGAAGLQGTFNGSDNANWPTAQPKSAADTST